MFINHAVLGGLPRMHGWMKLYNGYQTTGPSCSRINEVEPELIRVN